MHNTPLSRRDICKLGSAAFIGSTVTDSTYAQEDTGWIDAHVHVWTPNVDAHPLAQGFAIKDMQPSSFTPEELFAHCKPAGVSRIVLIQMSFYRFDNRYMTDMIRLHPGVFSGVGIVDLDSHDLVQRVSELASQGVRGFRIHASGEQARQWADHAGMLSLWRTAADQGLAVCPLMNPKDIPAVDRLCDRFRDTTVVVDHFARIGIDGHIHADDLNALCKLARFPRVYVKTSAFYALGAKAAPYQDLLPMIRRLVESFGPQRLMWASDCPFQVQGVHRYEPSIGLIRDAADEVLSQSDKQWLLRDTAAKVFF
jgi:predicted TIM-barrel fold metal-dependent hydrolase